MHTFCFETLGSSYPMTFQKVMPTLHFAISIVKEYLSQPLGQGRGRTFSVALVDKCVTFCIAVCIALPNESIKQSMLFYEHI